MSTVYISYKSEDGTIAKSLASNLEQMGHRVRYDQELFIGSEWRTHLMGALLNSDAVILIWTENTYRSQFVPAEVGAVRAHPHIGLIPVIVGDVDIPPFIHDLFSERISDSKPATLNELSKKIDRAIHKHIEHNNARPEGRPKVFISHRHKDEEIVRALTKCLESHFIIDKNDIRCTSVQPYRLPVGANSSERLRDEISDAEVVLGILSTDTLDSTYVAFELGAAWGQRVWTCPLLARGANQSHIPDPIKDLSPLFLSKTRECFQLLNDLEGFTSLIKRKGVDPKVMLAKVKDLAKTAKASLN